MTRLQLAKSIYEISYLKGQFKLRSGQTSNEYFDKYRFEAQPHILKEIAKQLAPQILKGCEVLAGLEMGGIPLATALSLETGIPTAFIRKEAKTYGTCQFAEGLHLKDKRVCLIEDVITTGGQVVQSANDLKGEGAIIEQVLCVIYRGESPAQNLLHHGLNYQPLFTMSELKAAATTPPSNL